MHQLTSDWILSIIYVKFRSLGATSWFCNGSRLKPGQKARQLLRPDHSNDLGARSLLGPVHKMTWLSSLILATSFYFLARSINPGSTWLPGPHCKQVCLERKISSQPSYFWFPQAKHFKSQFPNYQNICHAIENIKTPKIAHKFLPHNFPIKNIKECSEFPLPNHK